MTRDHAYHGAELLLDRAADWRDNAACRDVEDPAIFYPDQWLEPERTRTTLQALTYCAGCPVKAECRADAKRKGDHKTTIRGGIAPRKNKSKRQYALRECDGCGEQYEPRASNQRWCDKCRHDVRRRTKTQWARESRRKP